MLETVAKGFKAARNKLKGRTEITAEVVDDALRDIRVSLLEADVSFDVVKRFVARVREKAVGEVVETKVKTGKGKRAGHAAGPLRQDLPRRARGPDGPGRHLARRRRPEARPAS